jgi:DNA polymerase-3 subunit alpha
MDFPISKREAVVSYARKKYGTAHVAQMATFGRMQGRDALTDVLRAHQWGSFDERKAITATSPTSRPSPTNSRKCGRRPARPASSGGPSRTTPRLKEWCELKEDGTLKGPLAQYFAQAMRLEGTKKSQGKHAAGVVISPVALADECPMLYDKSTVDV